MKRWLQRPGVLLALAGVAAYVVCLLASLPAAWLGLALERASGGKAALGDPQGTVWTGRAALALHAGGGWKRVADIEWRCNPFALLLGRANFSLSGTAEGAQLRAEASLGASGGSFRDVDLDLPAAAIEPVVAAAALARPEGRLRLVADSIQVGAGSLRGAASLEWTGAGLGGMRASRLGDYRLQVTGSGDRAELSLATLRGELRFTGQGEWRAAQPRLVQMRGTAEAPAERKDLEFLMRALGLPAAGGTAPFTWSLPIG